MCVWWGGGGGGGRQFFQNSQNTENRPNNNNEALKGTLQREDTSEKEATFGWLECFTLTDTRNDCTWHNSAGISL